MAAVAGIVGQSILGAVGTALGFGAAGIAQVGLKKFIAPGPHQKKRPETGGERVLDKRLLNEESARIESGLQTKSGTGSYNEQELLQAFKALAPSDDLHRLLRPDQQQLRNYGVDDIRDYQQELKVRIDRESGGQLRELHRINKARTGRGLALKSILANQFVNSRTISPRDLWFLTSGIGHESETPY